jgi:hypothetical protein
MKNKNIAFAIKFNIFSNQLFLILESFGGVSMQNYISGVKLLHLSKGIDYPQFDSFHLKLVLKGLAKDNPHCPKQACPITH